MHGRNVSIIPMRVLDIPTTDVEIHTNAVARSVTHASLKSPVQYGHG
jgi:hypothetical protein